MMILFLWEYIKLFNSVELNTKDGKIKWKNVVYHKNLFDINDKKQLKDKRRKNFRLFCSHYVIKNDKLYIKRKRNN